MRFEIIGTIPEIEERNTWIRDDEALQKTAHKFAVCNNNSDYPASLELHKIESALLQAA